MSRPSPWARVRVGSKADTRELPGPVRSAPDADITACSIGACAARRYEDADVFRFSFARLPLCERPDIGNFAALVRPGIDRPELVGLAILDHGRVVRTLGD